MFFQSYNSPVMSGGLFGRGSDAVMVNDPSTNPIMTNKAFNNALKFAYKGYGMDKTNPQLKKRDFFAQYGNLMSPGQAPNQIEGALFGFAQNNFTPDLFGKKAPRTKNFGFNEGKFGQVSDFNQYMTAANNRWR